VADYNATSGELHVIHGKGNRSRICYVVNGARLAVAAWLAVRGDADGPLFFPTLKGGRIIERRMVSQSILDILKKLQRKAGVAKFSPHDVRRSHITALLDAGNDLLTVSALAGHQSADTTRRYDRRPEAAKKKAAETLHFPHAA